MVGDDGTAVDADDADGGDESGCVEFPSTFSEAVGA